MCIRDSHEGERYWVRQIPTFSAKVPVGIGHDEALQLAQAIGTQLGRGHRVVDEVYSDGEKSPLLIEALRSHRAEVVELGAAMNQAVLDLYNERTAG